METGENLQRIYSVDDARFGGHSSEHFSVERQAVGNLVEFNNSESFTVNPRKPFDYSVGTVRLFSWHRSVNKQWAKFGLCSSVNFLSTRLTCTTR